MIWLLVGCRFTRRGRRQTGGRISRDGLNEMNQTRIELIIEKMSAALSIVLPATGATGTLPIRGNRGPLEGAREERNPLASAM